MAKAAYLAPSLARGRTEINTRWPKRDHKSDGWIGDTAHQATKSDHNPAPPSMVVRATDTDNDGIDPAATVAAMCAHPATHYVIYDRKIYTRENGFRPYRYTGPSPHTEHIHRSILATRAAENSTVALFRTVAKPAPAKTAGAGITAADKALANGRPAVKLGASGRNARRVQALANALGAKLTEDGKYGPKSASAVKSIQGAHGIPATGTVDDATWTVLLRALLAGDPYRQGAKGAGAKALQALLNVYGYRLTEDGDLGPASAKAVRQFQDRYGLATDGVAGSATITALLVR